MGTAGSDPLSPEPSSMSVGFEACTSLLSLENKDFLTGSLTPACAKFSFSALALNVAKLPLLTASIFGTSLATLPGSRLVRPADTSGCCSSSLLPFLLPLPEGCLAAAAVGMAELLSMSICLQCCAVGPLAGLGTKGCKFAARGDCRCGSLSAHSQTCQRCAQTTNLQWLPTERHRCKPSNT